MGEPLIEQLQVRRALHLSRSSELALRQRWLAILSGKVRASLAVSGGVHTVADVIQSVMTGAHAVQIVSALLQHGPGHLAMLRRELTKWLEEHQSPLLGRAQAAERGVPHQVVAIFMAAPRQVLSATATAPAPRSSEREAPC